MATGMKTGGRQKGSKNKTTLFAEEAARNTLMNPGQFPLDYVLAIMRDDTQPIDRRLDMAKAALPYCHSRLSPVAPPEPPQEAELSSLELKAKLVEILIETGAIKLPKAMDSKKDGKEA